MRAPLLGHKKCPVMTFLPGTAVYVANDHVGLFLRRGWDVSEPSNVTSPTNLFGSRLEEPS